MDGTCVPAFHYYQICHPVSTRINLGQIKSLFANQYCNVSAVTQSCTLALLTVPSLPGRLPTAACRPAAVLFLV